MSTCPDPDLYSALLDGEVPSPWKEKLEAHLARCPSCAARFKAYGRIMTAIRASQKTPEASAEWLEASRARLESRMASSGLSFAPQGAGSLPFTGGSNRRDWTHSIVRLPLPALAAMLIAALVLPASVVLLASNAKQPAATGIAAMLPAQQLQVSQNSPVYSPDSLPQSITGKFLVSDGRLFSMVDYAKQFAPDGTLFDNAEIIIIKLPDLTHFTGSDDRILAGDESLQTAANFLK